MNAYVYACMCVSVKPEMNHSMDVLLVRTVYVCECECVYVYGYDNVCINMYVCFESIVA